VSWLGAAVLAAITVPAAHVLAQQPGQVPELILGFALFAPGLIGMGLIANLSRAMLALGRLKIVALAVAGSWILALVAEVILVENVPPRLVVAALALGVTIGQTAVAIPLVVIARRFRGAAAVHGLSHAALAGLAAAAVAAVVGVGISLLLPVTRKLAAGGVAVLAAAGATLAFGVVAYLLDDGDLRALLTRLRRLARLRS
jgi:putative peptidoglycan lipid II flippase